MSNYMLHLGALPSHGKHLSCADIKLRMTPPPEVKPTETWPQFHRAALSAQKVGPPNKIMLTTSQNNILQEQIVTGILLIYT